MIRVSLRDWIVKGELGPFRVGACKAELIRVVGHPDQAGCPEGRARRRRQDGADR